MSIFINFGILLKNMVKKIIITYELKNVKMPLKITRKIYGYIECSNNNKYQYKREGILSNINYEKLSRACIMINPKDANFVITEMKKLNINMMVLDIDLKKQQHFN